MGTPATHAWCPACKEESAIDNRGRCLWCLGPTEQRVAKRGGWTRPDLRGTRYTPEQLRALHAAHLRGQSINALARQTFEAVGYKSPGSAATAISREWKRMGLQTRDRIEQTVLSSTNHGRAPREGRDNAAYRRWFKQQNDRYRPACRATKRQAPGKGDPCDRPAMEGSEFCASHDPRRELARQAHLAGMRRRRARREMVPMEPFATWLRRRIAEEGSARALADLWDVSHSSVCRYAQGMESGASRPKPEIGRHVVERWLERDGTSSFEDLYGRELAAAA